jgi:hypothetical protein
MLADLADWMNTMVRGRVKTDGWADWTKTLVRERGKTILGWLERAN